MTKCIVLICGPPACLKSTLIKILQLIFNHEKIFNLKYFCIKKFYENFFKNKSEEIQYKYNYILFDNLFFGYENEIIKNELNWKLYRSLIANEIEKLIFSKSLNNTIINLKYSSQILNRLYQSLENLHYENNILIIEDNFYYSSMRHRYKQIAQRGQICFTSIHLYSSLSIALERNQKRDISKRVSDVSIKNIYSKYEIPEKDLLIDTTNHGLTIEHLNQILQHIKEICNKPLEQQINIIDDEQRRIATEINQQNFLYQIDQKLRKFISKYIKEEFLNNEKFQIINEKKFYAEMIHKKKQEFLELIKQKFILLNDNDDIEQIFKEFLQENY